MSESPLNNLFLESIAQRDLTKALHYLKQGADINTINDNGYSALYIAIKKGYPETIKFLLNNRINLGIESSSIEQNIVEILLQLPGNQVQTIGCIEGESKTHFPQEGINYDEVSEKLNQDAIYKLTHLKDFQTHPRIPFITHQVYFTSSINPKPIDSLSLKISIDRIKSLNSISPSWQHNIWTNDPACIPDEIKKTPNVKIRMIDELKDSTLWTELVNDLKEGESYKAMLARASDITRIITVEKEGGFYFDLDYQLYNSYQFSEIHKAFDFIGGKEKEPFEDSKLAPLFGSAFFAAIPHHNILNKTISLVKRNYNSELKDLPDYIKFACCKPSLNIYKTSGYPLTISAFLENNKNGNIDIITPNEVFFHYRYAHYTTPESKCFSPNHPASLTNYINGNKFITVGADTQCGSWTQTNNGQLRIIYYPHNINLYLFEAAKNGYTRIVKYLIEQGANVDEFSSSGATAAYMASQNGHKKTVELLIKHHANLTTPAKTNLTPLDGALLNKHYDIANFLLLHNAPSEASLLPLLLKQISLINVIESGNFPELVKFLLVNNKDSNEENDFGISALHLAIMNGYFETANLLLNANANPNTYLENGYTALQTAVEKNYTNIVELLLEFNATPEIKNNYNETALDLALYYNHSQIVDILSNSTNFQMIGVIEGH